MQPSFLEWASICGQVFEVAVKRGVLQNLIHQKLLDNQHPVLQPWQETKNGQISHQMLKSLNLTDPNAREWAETMVRHLLVFGYGLGWTAMQECLKQNRVRQPKLEAIWCPLTLPGQKMQQDEEIQETAQAFKAAFNLSGSPDAALLKQGQPARADFLLWLSSEQNVEGISTREVRKKKPQKFANFILCLEFSYNAPAKLADFSSETAHREEIARYARYIDSRGVFSRVCAEVEGEEFSISSKLAGHLFAFSGSDKPLFKLCQASSYTERLIHLLQTCGRLQEACSTRAIAVTSNGFESLAAYFIGQQPEPDPRARLMKSLGEAYQKAKKLGDDGSSELEQEIGVVFNKLLGGLPTHFKEQAKILRKLPNIGGHLHFLFKENVEGFYNSMQGVPREDAIAAIEETAELKEFFGSNPRFHFIEALNELKLNKEQIPLRDVHKAAVVAGLNSAQTGKLNAIALEGNPGIGKTTAVVEFLKQQSEGFMFLYLSPRVVINRNVTAELARENGKATGISTLTSNSTLIASASEWYKQQVETNGWKNRLIDSAVVVDGVENIKHPDCSTVFVTPEQERQIECDFPYSNRFKRSLSEREDSLHSPSRPGVLRTLATSARKLLEVNPKVNRLVITAATQGYRSLDQKTTVDCLKNLFSKKANTAPGKNERLAFGAKIPTIIAMVDELAGDGAGALFVHELANLLHEQFIEPFQGSQSPFKVILIVSDASLSNEVVLNNFLNSKDSEPDKVLISKSQGEAAFRVTGTYTKAGLKKYPTLHIMTNSYPASKLDIDYSIRLSPITPGLTSDGKKQSIRQAIREQVEDELLSNAYQEIQHGLKQGAEQLIFFAQDKAFLRQLREKLTTGKDALCQGKEVAVLDQSVQPHQRLELVQEPRRDEIKIFLMTSSGSRGVSFPKADWIIAAIPRFNIEAALMEIAQLIYRGRGMYTHPETGEKVSGDNKARQLVMLINDFIIIDEDIDRSRVWLRQASDLLTLLMMLRSTIHTRIKGDAGLKKARIAFVPVGAIEAEELISLMSDDARTFLHEAQVFIRDDHSKDAKGIVAKADQLITQIFSGLDLQGLAKDRKARSFVNYQTLAALVTNVSRSSSRLLPSLNDALIIPDCLNCIGPFWIEDWSDRSCQEAFKFEGWKVNIQDNIRHLLGLLRRIYEDKKFPPKLKRSANELYKVLIREKEQLSVEYSTFHALKTENLAISLPLDYPHFWREQLEDDSREQVLEDPQAWRTALGRSLTTTGLVMPVVPKYRAFPWVAVPGQQISANFKTIFDERYFMASGELNLLNTILLEDEPESNL
ncbi:MAG TPA: helicase-related protein [Oculatellaceae cyanobacterium]